MTKFNVGCGARIADGWVNVDFHSNDPRVRQVNLLKGLPFPCNQVDAVYSSHVIEHFTRDQALFILTEAHRVLKPTGTLRIVVPDLEGTCREYLRILALPDSDRTKLSYYEWILIEMLDQLVRTRPSGEMGSFFQEVVSGDKREMLEYVRSRTESALSSMPTGKSAAIMERLLKVNVGKLSNAVTYWYLRCIRLLIPQHLRSMVLVETSVGERHRWMYDSYGLRRLCEDAGFGNCRSLTYNMSSISGFCEDHLDSNPDGTRYKNNSIYMEASKQFTV